MTQHLHGSTSGAQNQHFGYPKSGDGQAGRSIAAEWAEHAEALADWALARVFVRLDVHGGYTKSGGQITSREPLDRERLILHFGGEITVGAHSISAEDTCKCAAWDIDNHGGKADPDVNFRQALRITELVSALGLVALVCDSDGKGGYHPRVFFKGTVPSAVAYWLTERIKTTLVAEGFPACEGFPKQAETTLEHPYGNWIRLPGKKANRDHWTRIYDPKGDRWLEGRDAARRLLGVAGDDPSAMLAAYREEQAAREAERPKPDSRRSTWEMTHARFRDDKPDAATVRSALEALPESWSDCYGGTRAETGWLGVGMALHDWDPGAGLDLWHEFSRRSPKYDAAVCESKWKTFTAGGGLTVRTIFKAAYDRGWVAPGAHRKNGTPANGVHRNGTTDGEPVVGTIEAVEAPADDADIVDRWPKADPRVYHGVAGDFVRAVAPHTEADPIAVLGQFLVMIGSVNGRSAYYPVGAGRHYTNEYLALVGHSSVGRKGSSWEAVGYAARGLDEAWAKTRILGGLVSGEGLIHHVRDPVYEKREVKEEKGGRRNAAAREVTVGRPTVDVCVDPGIEDKRLLIIETEMSRVLKAMNRDSNTLSDVFRQGWDGGDLSTMSKHHANRATAAHISAICHITPADIDKYLLDTDALNGFGNRFLWLASRRSKYLPDGGDFEGPDFQARWEKIRFRLGGVVEFGRTCGRMTRSRDAAHIWRGVYEELTGGKPGLLGTVLARATAHVTRLACIYAVLDESRVVEADHMLAALALWDYSEASARFIFGNRLGDSDAEKLIAGLKKALPGGLSRTEISVKVFGGHKPKAEIDALLGNLLTLGEIHKAPPEQPAAPGRKAVIWRAGRGES